MNSIIKEADVKKQGIIVKKQPAHKVKGNFTTQDFIGAASAKKEAPSDGSKIGDGTPSRNTNRRPATV